MADSKDHKAHPDTIITTAGRKPFDNQGVVNPPVYHASTILQPTLKALRETKPAPGTTYYGRRGTPTTFALEEAILGVEGGAGCVLYPSGLAALYGALLAYLQPGDHLLMVDTVYGPTRTICDDVLKKMGVETTYYPPCIAKDKLAKLFKENTKVIFTESPGSLTFEVQDLPMISEVAHSKGAVVMLDNTWSAGYFFKPFDKGVDISIQAGTKYFVGHSDVMMGCITATSEHIQRIRHYAGITGQCLGPDDAYLAQRGIRTLPVRLKLHNDNGIQVAHWLNKHPAVSRVMHPALVDDPHHALWRRDFTGASGLFGLVLKPCSFEALSAMCDNMQHFGMGYSWGGYESLILPNEPHRTAEKWTEPGQCIRLHVGLENVDDLIEDLDAGLKRLTATD